VFQLKFEGENNEKILGPVSVDMTSSSFVCDFSKAIGNTITLNCSKADGGGILLSETIATDFYIAVPALTYSAGYKIIIETSDGTFEHKITGPVTLTQGKIEVSPEYKIDFPIGIPTQLNLKGTATENDGRKLRKISDGVFEIYTTIGTGTLYLESNKGKKYYYDSGEYVIGDGNLDIPQNNDFHLYRIKVDMNAKTLDYTELHSIGWMVFPDDGNYNIPFNYIGGGIFKVGEAANNYMVTLPAAVVRYYFLVNLHISGGYQGENWGRTLFDGRPDSATPQSYWDITTYTTTFDWPIIYAFASTMDGKQAKITIDSNLDGNLNHVIEIVN
jgi:hypothetical protein